MSDLSLLPSNAVAINGTRPVTTSLVIADVFGKRHDNVLRDIETLECSEAFRLLNFEERNRELVTGKNTVQEYRYYDITKDGFVFLVMGYRGPKAAQFKEAYIGRFNELEDGLRSPPLPALPALPALITPAQAGELSTLIAERFPDGKQRPYAWSRFKNHFRVASYRELPASRFAEACAYIPTMPVKDPAPVTPLALSGPIPLPSDPGGQRWLASHGAHGWTLQEIPPESYVLPVAGWPAVIRHEPLPRDDLLALLVSVADRLSINHPARSH